MLLKGTFTPAYRARVLLAVGAGVTTLSGPKGQGQVCLDANITDTSFTFHQFLPATVPWIVTFLLLLLHHLFPCAWSGVQHILTQPRSSNSGCDEDGMGEAARTFRAEDPQSKPLFLWLKAENVLGSVNARAQRCWERALFFVLSLLVSAWKIIYTQSHTGVTIAPINHLVKRSPHTKADSLKPC